MPGLPQPKTKAEFDQVLADAKGLVAVDFTATWCGPCKMIGPKFEAMAAEEADVLFIKVDVDENDETAAALGIQCYPTFVFFRNGEKVGEFSGADEAELRAKVAELK